MALVCASLSVSFMARRNFVRQAVKEKVKAM